MNDQTPAALVLSGFFGALEAEGLSDHCRRLGRAGRARVVLDVAGVTRCDRAGLTCWRALSEGAGGTGRAGGLTVVIEGARWSQFLDLLRDTPIGELSSVCDEVRRTVSPATARPSRPAQAHRRPAWDDRCLDRPAG